MVRWLNKKEKGEDKTKLLCWQKEEGRKAYTQGSCVSRDHRPPNLLGGQVGAIHQKETMRVPFREEEVVGACKCGNIYI